jgi:hypothetical protein
LRGIKFAERTQVNVGGGGLENKLRVPSVDKGRIGGVQHVERGGEKSFAIHVGNVGGESGVAPHTRAKGGAMDGVSGGSALVVSSIRRKDSIMIIMSVSSEVKRSNNMAGGISNNGRGGCRRRKGTKRRLWGGRKNWYAWRIVGTREEHAGIGSTALGRRWSSKEGSSFIRWGAGIDFECKRVKESSPIKRSEAIVMSFIPDGQRYQGFIVEVIVPGGKGLKGIETHASAKNGVRIVARVTDKVAKVAEK